MEIAFETLFTIVMLVFFVGIFCGVGIGVVVKSKRNPDDFDYAPEFNWKEFRDKVISWLKKEVKTSKKVKENEIV